MLFLISFVIASVFVLALGKSLRKHPVPYYIGVAAITLLIIGLDLAGVKYSGFMKDWIMPLFTKGALAGALFVVIMWGGALPNGTKPVKSIMPVRGQLSILASILVFYHACTYRSHIISLFKGSGSLKGAQLAAAICSLGLLLLLIPLFVTSFKAIRKRIPPKKWKALQRSAYVFYALIPAHILLFTYKYAWMGKSGYRFNAVIYTWIFLTYAVCRIMKAVAVKRKDQSKLVTGQLKAVAATATAIMLATAILFGDVPKELDIKETRVALDSVIKSEPSTSPEPSPSPNPSEEETGYKDGTFTGEAFGNSGIITVQITIKDDIITAVEILEQDEDEPYFTDALEVIPAILEANGTDVDTVSGATYSSEGILEAVEEALRSAKK